METLAKKPETVARLYDEKARLYKFVMKDKGPLKSGRYMTIDDIR